MLRGPCRFQRVAVMQQKLIFNRDRDNCFKAFMNNNYVGLVLFLGLAMSYL